MHDCPFESLLSIAAECSLKDAAREVLDTARLCHTWLEVSDKPYTTDHVIQLTKLVLEQNRLNLKHRS